MTHADEIILWLKELGYSHCFFVAGGNSMHLLNSARQTMTCVPFVHEVSAGIAAEYFNETALSAGKAFVLVTAGPGMTNLVTALAGAFLESRELLVLGGQVKSSDLATDGIRQRGIQEIDGVAIATPVTKIALCLTKPIKKTDFDQIVSAGFTGRPGPIFIEFCLDAQGVTVDQSTSRQDITKLLISDVMPIASSSEIQNAMALLVGAKKPILLLGGGISRSAMKQLLPIIEKSGLPVMTTWNAADRFPSDHLQYLGRPNTWGQRSSNMLIQQADLVLAVGTRLGLQQTGFNWSEFVPNGKIIHVDVDMRELVKGHPVTELAVCAEGEDFLARLLTEIQSLQNPMWAEWLAHGKFVRDLIPVSETINGQHEGFLNPFDFVLSLSNLSNEKDVVVPCSSGSAFTVMMQAFGQKDGQVIITNKGLASMGYGSAGAIGASLSDRNRRTILVEGDGGFSQNLQELATIDVQKLNIKIFIFANEGYASIRMTQRNYFDGAYLGCDTQTGLGFPNWSVLATAFGIASTILDRDFLNATDFQESWMSNEPHLYVVPIHPEQSFFPKISSRITASGGMESAPLHEMTPPLTAEIQALVEEVTHLPGGK
jgi:acetolactate synthase-1/2/3 large subunit